VSQTIVTIPLAILYETSIFIAARMDKKRAKQQNA